MLTPTLVPPSTAQAQRSDHQFVARCRGVGALAGRVIAVAVIHAPVRVTPDELPALVAAATSSNPNIVGCAAPPSSGQRPGRVSGQRMAPLVEPTSVVAQPPTAVDLFGPAPCHPDREFRLRPAATLWHGDKSFQQLSCRCHRCTRFAPDNADATSPRSTAMATWR